MFYLKPGYYLGNNFGAYKWYNGILLDISFTQSSALKWNFSEMHSNIKVHFADSQRRCIYQYENQPTRKLRICTQQLHT